MPRKNLVIGETHDRRHEFAPHQPPRILEAVPVVRAHTAERGYEPDTQPPAGAPGALDIVRGTVWRITQQNAKQVADIHAELERRTANQRLDATLLEILLALGARILVDLRSVLQ